MLFVNRCAREHIVLEATKLLSKKEIEALNGKPGPEGVII